MNLNLGSLSFNLNLDNNGGTPAWGTELGQGEGYKFNFEDMADFMTGMLYNAVEDVSEVTCPLGKGGNQRNDYEFVIASLFNKVFVNGKKVPNASFLLLIVKKIAGDHHVGRRTLKYNPRMTYRGEVINERCFKLIEKTLNIDNKPAWFIDEIEIKNQDELHFKALVINAHSSVTYKDNDEKKAAMQGIKRRLFKGNVISSNETETSIQKQFEYYLYHCLRSQRNKGMDFNYTESAVTSNISYSKSQTLLGPVSVKWPTFKSLFQITDPQEFQKFFKELVEDSDFTKYDNSVRSWPMATLMNYSCFLHARNYFMNKNISDDSLKTTYKSDMPLQLIYFGAPGTSKSTTIKKIIGNASKHRITFHPDTDYSNFVGCYKPTKNTDSDDITYTFVPQTFVKAYVEAWKNLYDDKLTDKRVYLVIEEINRGNCAQIFGDLFQLLDRDDRGYSDYEIEPDEDLQRYLKEEAFADDINIPEKIKSGTIMVLPPNLLIWATMNTSDQSLFPIDSAFKRRWEWKYLPIKNEDKGHVIRVDKKHVYKWWGFLDAVNNRIENLTGQEDKQLGYWFAKPDNGVEISLDRFVSKVVFYLWNDVFKDFVKDANSPFVIKDEEDKKHDLKFNMFFDDSGNALTSAAIVFIENLGLKPLEIKETETSQGLEGESISYPTQQALDFSENDDVDDPLDEETEREIEEYNESFESTSESSEEQEILANEEEEKEQQSNVDVRVDVDLKDEPTKKTGVGDFLRDLYKKHK